MFTFKLLKIVHKNDPNQEVSDLITIFFDKIMNKAETQSAENIELDSVNHNISRIYYLPIKQMRSI